MSTITVIERYTDKERVFTSVNNVFPENGFLHIISGRTRTSLNLKDIGEYREVILP